MCKCQDRASVSRKEGCLAVYMHVQQTILPNCTDDRHDLIQGFLPLFVSWTGIEKEATG